MSKDVEWSEAQKIAIRTINKNVLLNAGAGSGKTAVLSEHVIHLLHNNFELDKLLIMTFTKAAANEMKNRIKKKIQKDPILNVKCGDLIDAAHIETFDSFFLFVVKKYHYELNVSKNIDIIDENVLLTITKQITDEVLNEYYHKKPANFIDIVNEYCIKDDDILKTLIEDILRNADLSIDKEAYFKDFITNHFNDGLYDHLCCLKFDEYRDYLHICLNLIKDFNVPSDKTVFNEIFSSALKCKDYDELYDYMINFDKFPNAPKPCIYVELRNNVKSLFNDKIKKDIKSYGDTDEVKKICETNKPLAKVCLELALKIDQKLNEFKRIHNVYSFSDVAKMALKLTENVEILNELRESFTYIMVDEYQDTSDIQEAMLAKLENHNLFMVGDVKQSIYGFRNANCQIFQHKNDIYKKIDMSDDPDNEKEIEEIVNNLYEDYPGIVIPMTLNFRSRPELVNDFDKAFSNIMNKEINIIDYLGDNHTTKAGLKEYASFAQGQKYGMQFINYDKTGDMSTIEYEAHIIARDIIKKMNDKYKILGKDMTLRPVIYKDFAIIMDRGTSFDTYRRVFAEYNIPLYVYDDTKVTQKTMFLLAPNLLKMFDYVSRGYYGEGFDHAYMSICRSFIVNKKDDEIYKTVLKGKDGYIEDEVVKSFKDLTKTYKNSSLYDIMTSIFNKFDIYDKIKSVGDYYSYSYEIKVILDLMTSLDKLDYDVIKAIEYFKNISKFGSEIKAPPFEESENSVIILNIHKSKGLEYPICYFAGFGKEFMQKSFNRKAQCHDKYGFYAPILHQGDSVDNIEHGVSKSQGKVNDFEEKLRWLYVAITRARENAIIVQSVNKKDVDYVKHSKSMSQILSIYDFKGYDSKLVEDIDVSYPEKVIKTDEKPANPQQKKDEKLEFILNNPIEIEYEQINKTRASKDKSDDVDQKALDYGTHMHLLLELASGPDDDLSYIKDEKEREKVQKVLKCPVFQGVKPENIRHEFGFYDENKELLGYIDCMLIKDNEIDIIDFKLKNIDDDAYKKQLKVYYDYINSLNTGKVVKTYLLSIVDGIEKEVPMDE